MLLRGNQALRLLSEILIKLGHKYMGEIGG